MAPSAEWLQAYVLNRELREGDVLVERSPGSPSPVWPGWGAPRRFEVKGTEEEKTRFGRVQALVVVQQLINEGPVEPPQRFPMDEDRWEGVVPVEKRTDLKQK